MLFSVTIIRSRFKGFVQADILLPRPYRKSYGRTNHLVLKRKECNKLFKLLVKLGRRLFHWGSFWCTLLSWLVHREKTKHEFFV